MFKVFKFILTLLLFVFFTNTNAQTLDSLNKTIVPKTKKLKIAKDTTNSTFLNFGNNATKPILVTDTNANKILYSKDAPDSTIHYSADDSIIFDAVSNKCYLYNNSALSYKTMDLEAYNIVIDWKQHTLDANGGLDSNKKEIGTPYFKEEEKIYNSKKILFNYETKKGKIYDFVTQEDEGYIHSKVIKKTSTDAYLGANADYTTCDKEHPDFSIHSNKIKVIPNKLIVTGPANLVIADVPTPLYLPFGIFPTKKRQNSGILIPVFSQNFTKGFGLVDGGYYFVIGKHHDLALQADIFSLGSWAAKATSSYYYKYKFRGNFNINYGTTLNGDPQEKSFYKYKDFKIIWNHSQDAKANPHNNFSASVNFGTSRYDRNNSMDINNIVTNTNYSSVTYTRIFTNLPFNLNVNANQSQNTRTKEVNISLPNVNFTVNRINPFKRKVQVGKTRWYENIGVDYSSNLQNYIQTYDTLLFTKTKFKDFNNAILHKANASTNIQILKHFTLIPSLNYAENWTLKTVSQSRDTAFEIIRTDIAGFKAQRNLNADLRLYTRLYGMKQFKKGSLKAIRHMIIPNIGMSWHPDYASNFWGYYKRNPADENGQSQLYSIFENNRIFSTPAPGKYATMTFGVNNDLEIKVVDKKDTINQTRKISIIKSFNINGGYNFAADSFKLQDFNISGNTVLLKKINATASMTFSPYYFENNRKYNQLAIEKNGSIGKIRRATISIGSAIDSKEKPNFSTAKGAKNKKNDALINFDVWHIPYSLSFNYMLSITPQTINYKDTIIYSQSVSWTLDCSLTNKWKASVNSGYDFNHKKIGITNIAIIRDLHCWQMRLNITPGYFYSIDINVNASVLNDLKINKRKNYVGYLEE